MQASTSRLHPLLVLFLFALALPLAGCKKPEYPECKRDKHCKVDLGEKCVDGKCQNCATDEDCRAKGPGGVDWVCHDLRCQDPNAIEGSGGPGALGSPCTQTIDCGGGLVCTAGKCSHCTDDFQCSPGTCDIGSGLCSSPMAGGQCTTDDQCAMDEICDNGMCVFSGSFGGGNNPCGLDAVFFGFDSPQISGEAAEQLRGVAECLKQHGGQVFLEAHADPRGTEEYNIMLTDRRGQSVKRFLQDLGVQGDKMQVISKGDLESRGTDEASWSKDRRVEFIFP